MNEPAPTRTPLSISTDNSLRANRLSIADLLLITLGTAIIIWFWMPVQGELNPLQTTVNVLFAPLYGSGIAAVLVALYRAQKNLAPFVTQPGHWLLLLTGTTVAALGLFVKSSPIPSEIPPTSETVLIFRVLGALTAAILLLFSAGILLSMAFGAVEDSPRWRWVFQLTAAMVGVLVFGACCVDPLGSPPLFLIAIPVFGVPILLLVATIAAIMDDHFHCSVRDFWHWLGVAAFFGIPLHLALLFVVSVNSP